jgi:hypothetical protein
MLDQEVYGFGTVFCDTDGQRRGDNAVFVPGKTRAGAGGEAGWQEGQQLFGDSRHFVDGRQKKSDRVQGYSAKGGKIA